MSSKNKSNAKNKEEPILHEHQRLQKLLIELVEQRAPEQVKPYLRQAAPTLVALWFHFLAALPHIVKAVKFAQELVAKLPERLLWAILGFVVCFFGGIFPATIAAVEAWKTCGGSASIDCCKDLYREFLAAQAASKKDDDKDVNKDGIKDVDQMDPKALILRKVQLVVKAVDPEKVSSGVTGLYTGWIGVVAVLKIRFARTVTLGEAIGTQLNRPAQQLAPVLASVLPEEYKRWSPVIVRWSCKMLAVTIAWWIQRVIETFHSAIRGGHLFGKHLVNYLHEQGILKTSADSTNIDEVIGWGLAAVGVLFQLSMGFHLPFPLNILLFPVRLLESFIVWSVSMTP